MTAVVTYLKGWEIRRECFLYFSLHWAELELLDLSYRETPVAQGKDEASNLLISGDPDVCKQASAVSGWEAMGSFPTKRGYSGGMLSNHV